MFKDNLGVSAPENRRFCPGQRYLLSDWFTGGQSFLTVSRIDEGRVYFEVTGYEADGVSKREEAYNLSTDKAGNESVLIFIYKGHECRIRAGEVANE